ncbi:DUF4956 domain-containing protein [Hymenobacter sp. BT635]|uniref:DUF4956 domain-containing protein n=1 Tax=Hymenobacter nitidus TaxID=2880929 RepID=A0ABS8ADL4_9BACT|nr:DUF4956 domain-containing protein [Hymenobacter nitidus]MCB2378239.1 DUF4956 domain-containing protein [Hymenobacter nitidus]
MPPVLPDVFNFSITLREVLGNTVWATLCGGIIAGFYVLAFRHGGYSLNLIKSIVMLTIITAFVMMVVGDNLAQAFSIVGILSIIRFRTSPKDAQGFMYLFFALAIGLACGKGLHLVAVVGCLLIGLVTTLMARVLTNAQSRVFILTLTLSGSTATHPAYQPVLDSFCKRYRLLGTKASKKGGIGAKTPVPESPDLMQLRYLVGLKEGKGDDVFVDALREIESIREVNLQIDEE